MANEAKEFAAGAINGAHAIVNMAEKEFREALDTKGPREPIGFPDTKYFLPVHHGLTGEKIEELSHLERITKEAKSLLGDVPADKLYLPYLGNALNAGIATLFAQEVLETLSFIIEPESLNKIWLRVPSDQMVLKHGGRIVEQNAAGFATLIGGAPSNETAKELAMGLVKENFYVFLVGSNSDTSIARQLEDQGATLGWDDRLVPLGPQLYSQVLAIGFAVRMAIILGKINPGDYQRILKYCESNIFGFFMIPDDLDDEKRAAAAGAISFGFLTMAKSYVHQLLPVHTLHRLR